MLQKFKISSQAIIIFLLGISFVFVALVLDVTAQEGAHRHQSLESQVQSLQGMISTLTSRVDALEGAQGHASSAPSSHPEAFTLHPSTPISPSATNAVCSATVARGNGCWSAP